MDAGAQVDPFAAIAQPAAPAAPPPSSTAGQDPFAAIAKPVAQPALALPAHDAQSADLATNPGKEGTYLMKNPQGLMVPVPYSNVHRALDQGHLFADKGNLQQYARDHAADPLDEDRVNQWIDQHPYLSRPVQGLLGAGTGVLKTMTGLDRTPTTRGETELQLGAATPAHTPAEAGGEAAENLGEFFSGEELLGMLGKVGDGMGLADKLKSVTGLAQMVEKYPMLAKLLKIGSSAAKQGTVAGAQTLAKTGDPAAGATAASEAAAGGTVLDTLGAGATAARTAMRGVPAEVAPAVEKTVAGVKIPVAPEAAVAAASPTAQASSRAYGQLARDAIAPHLEALNSAPKLTEDTLATTHDLTGAADRMQQKVLNPLYDTLNTATGGKFRTLNSEVQQAQKAARSGMPADVDAYRNKLAEMDNLLDNETGGAVPKNYVQKIKAAWTQSYMLDDLGDMWDRNLNGAPGASKVSQEQRGLNGNGLMADIQRAVKIHGRDRIETALGPGRLENFEDIARWNQTNAKRRAFNIGLQEVASNMPEGKAALAEKAKTAGRAVAPHIIAGAVGGAVGHATGIGGWEGMAAGEVGYAAVQKALNAIKMNPQIGKNFMFALESGATAKKYGPFIATMIQKQQTEAARERVASEGAPQ